MGMTVRAEIASQFDAAYLRFAHNFTGRPDPNDEDEFLALGLFVVRVAHANIRIRCLGLVQMLAKLVQTTRPGCCQLQLIRAIRLWYTHSSVSDDAGE